MKNLYLTLCEVLWYQHIFTVHKNVGKYLTQVVWGKNISHNRWGKILHIFREVENIWHNWWGKNTSPKSCELYGKFIPQDLCEVIFPHQLCQIFFTSRLMWGIYLIDCVRYFLPHTTWVRYFLPYDLYKKFLPHDLCEVFFLHFLYTVKICWCHSTSQVWGKVFSYQQ